MTVAVQEARADFERLYYAHTPAWTLDLSGTVQWECSCNKGFARSSGAMDSHILEVVRMTRGPTRPPKK